MIGLVLLGLIAWWCWPGSDENPGQLLAPPLPQPAEPAAMQATEPAPSARVAETPPAAAPTAEPEQLVALRVVGRVLDGDKEAPLAGAKIEFVDVLWAAGAREPRLKTETI